MEFFITEKDLMLITQSLKIIDKIISRDLRIIVLAVRVFSSKEKSGLFLRADCIDDVFYVSGRIL